MREAKIQDYKMRVANILKVFKYQYGFRSDLVCVNSQTVGTEAFNIMQAILDEKNIGLEVDDRVPVGKFMFVNANLKRPPAW